MTSALFIDPQTEEISGQFGPEINNWSPEEFVKKSRHLKKEGPRDLFLRPSFIEEKAGYNTQDFVLSKLSQRPHIGV